MLFSVAQALSIALYKNIDTTVATTHSVIHNALETITIIFINDTTLVNGYLFNDEFFLGVKPTVEMPCCKNPYLFSVSYGLTESIVE